MLFAFIKKRWFNQEVKKALAGGVLTEESLDRLKRRSAELGIGEQFLIEQRQEDYRRRAAPIIARILASRRFSPADESELLEMANALHVNASFANEYTRFRLLWTYENTGEISLTAIPTSIILQKNEECYFRAAATWSQLTTIKVRQGYAGMGVSLRIARGVRFHTGRSAPVYSEHQGLKLVSTGELHITNKRLIFSGAQRSENIPFKKIIDIKQFQDGIEIIKESGKPDYLQMKQEDAELSCIFLQKLIGQEQRKVMA